MDAAYCRTNASVVFCNVTEALQIDKIIWKTAQPQQAEPAT